MTTLIKISQLPSATTPLQGGELMTIIQGGVSKKISTEALNDLLTSPVNAGVTAAEAAAAAAASSASSASSSATLAATQVSSAQTYATNSSNSANNSAASATLAQQWATKTDAEVVNGQGFGAKKYAQDAATSAASMSSSVSAAAASATTAAASETAAIGYKNQAAASATTATTQAGIATTKAGEAAASATAAATSASTASSAASNTYVTTIGSDLAGNSWAYDLGLITDAAVQPTNSSPGYIQTAVTNLSAIQAAPTQATNAANSATAANTAKVAAEAAQTAAETAQTGAVSAKTASESARDLASGYATTATTQASTATTKASEASTSAANALTYKTAAEIAKTAAQSAQTASETARDASVTAKTAAESASVLASDWAIKTTGPVTGSSYSAKYYANQAATTFASVELLANKNQANGYAGLDATGKVAAAQLPSYVDDVVEGANLAALPGTGETGKIYVTLDTNKTYRWSGSAYVEISASPGSTDSVTEGSTNLYFTTARARASISVSGSLSYANGVISYTQPTNVSTFTNDSGYLTAVPNASITEAKLASTLDLGVLA